MKTKRILIILSFVLSISMLSSLFAFVGANAQKNRVIEIMEEETQLAPILIENNVDKTKKINYSGKNIDTEYKYTFYYSLNKSVNKYSDEQGITYGIDSSDRLIEYSNNASEETTSEAKISQQKAVEIAFEQLNKHFADIADGFELSYIDFSNKTYTVELQKKYGSGGFAFGEKMLLYIRSDGVIDKWYMNGVEELTGFDKSVMNGITEKDVVDFANEQLNAAVENSADEYDLSSISIKKVNEQFALRVYMRNSDGTLGKEIYYAL